VLSVKSLQTEYSGAGGQTVKAAQDVSFEVPHGALFTLLGPSGCGKTTTLRSIAGLERPQRGEIELGGRIVFSSAKGVFVSPNKRNFGMVFQSYAIWPHMNVFKNVAFPLEVRKPRLSLRAIHEKVMRVLSVVQLAELADRDATKLSGGQQQRLALARALVMEPQLLLLDEPLSNLDAKLREKMRFELKRMQRDLGLTTIYVTHDQSEALALSDEIAVMNEGRIVQIGSPRNIYERPRNKFVADFVGNTNFIDGKILSAGSGSGRCRVATPIGELNVQCVEALAQGAPVVVSVRPEDVELSEHAPAREEDDNVYRGVVNAQVFLGDSIDFQVKVGAAILLARVHPSLRTPTGDPIHVRMRAEKCVAIAKIAISRGAAAAAHTL
jgi:iron(III) transport system ATP-binding protein